jgi:aryl-alcohol dehydrogenase
MIKADDKLFDWREIMDIKAAITNSAGSKFSIETIQIEEPRENEVLVKIKATGICHTDISAQKQYVSYPLPGVLGHEGAGIVEKVGSAVTKVKPGDHVILSWLSCGVCDACKAGKNTCCKDFLKLNFGGFRADGSTYLSKGGKVIHGSFFGQSSFASHSIALEDNVLKVSKDLPIETLAPLGCGVMTGAGAVMNTLHPKPGDSIAVFGSGTVGMSAIMAARVCGCTTIIAVDIKPERLKLAKEIGATHTVNSAEVDPVKTILEITNGGPNFSLECIGNPAVFRQSTDILPLMGTGGLVGVVAPGTEVSLNMDLIMNARTIKGIIEGDAIPDLFIPRLIELNRQGRFPYDKLIKYYPFEDINQAVEDMEKGLVIKPVLIQ